MDEESLSILEKIFLAGLSNPSGVNAKKFRVDNYDHIKIINELEQNQYIENRDNQYFIKLLPLLDLSEWNEQASHFLQVCETLFKELRAFYKETHGEKEITLNELSRRTNINRSEISTAYMYLLQGGLFQSYSHSNIDEDSASLTPGENILKYQSFRERMVDIKKMAQSHKESWNQELPIFGAYSPGGPYQHRDYIHQDIIAGLSSLKTDQFDLKRLITICKEINDCAKHENVLALGALLRMLLDHVPPIFGYQTFVQVTSNSQLGRSLKKTLENLEKNSRNISDEILHQTIRNKETVPTINRVDFSPSIDALLGEIIRKIESENN